MKYGRTVAMTNQYWDEDEDNETPDTPTDGGRAMSELRKAKRADEKRIKDLTDQLDSFNKDLQFLTHSLNVYGYL
jgi:hypothetical protein